MKVNSVVSMMRSAELFRGLSPSACERISSTSSEEVFSSGQQIFRQSESKQKIFLLMEGLVKVSQLNHQGDETILWLNVPGEVIGSIACSSDSKHSSTAIAVRSCRVVMWRLPAFEAIMDRFPILLRNVENIIESQKAELSSRIWEVSAPTELCLARALIRIADRIVRRVNASFEVNLPQEFLVSMIGTTVYYVNRLLSLWGRQGLVVRRRCFIVIRDLAGLRNLSLKTYRSTYAKGYSVLSSSGIETSELSRNAVRALDLPHNGERLGSELRDDTLTG